MKSMHHIILGLTRLVMHLSLIINEYVSGFKGKSRGISSASGGDGGMVQMHIALVPECREGKHR